MTFFEWLDGREATTDRLDEYARVSAAWSVDPNLATRGEDPGASAVSYAAAVDLAYGSGSYDAAADALGQAREWGGEAAQAVGGALGGLFWVAALGVGAVVLLACARR